MTPDGGPLTAQEVPILGGDKLRWIELTVPSSSPSSPDPAAPIPSRDVAGCQVIPGDPTAYLTWRIHKDLPNVLEVVELFASKEFPETGLHLAFQDAICPFAFICTNQIHSTARKQYMLYVLTVSGVAYCLYLRSPFTYNSGSNFPRDEILEFDLEKHMSAKITAVAATSGCLVTGRQDGSIGCFRLGGLGFDAPDFYTELRDDAGRGRLWNIMSRAKNVASVQDMVISQVCGRNLLFALHLDGCLRIWDFSSRTRIMNHNISLGEPAGITPSKLWVGASNVSTNSILLAVLYRGDSVADTIAVCNFDCSVGDEIFSSEPVMRIIHLEQERLVDLTISSSKLWLLKEDGSMMFSLSQTDCKLEHSFSYVTQEDFLAEVLFQCTEYTFDEPIWTNNSIFSLLKGQITNFISSIFLRRLLQTGVHQAAALRAVASDQTKYLFDHEYQSLTLAALTKEISSIIESEGVAASSSSTICYWKNFCFHFFRYWCQNNNPYGLFIDSSNDVVGLIRKNSVSVFRSLEGLELLLLNADFSGESNDLKSFGLIIPDNEVDCEILCEVLRCTCSISSQLGRAASALFYESLVNPSISSDDVLFHLLKILETGYSPSSSASFILHVGEDTTSERRQVAPPRKFSVYMFLSLHALRSSATSWTKVLDVITKYLDYLKPQKCILKYDTKGMCNINSSLLVLATSQNARVMLDASFDILLLLGYLINVSGQVDMMQTDVARIKLELIPMIQEAVTHWLILHFLGTTPTTSPAIDDFSSRLSSLHIGNTSGKGSFDAKLGSSDLSLACLLDFPSADDSLSFLSSTSFPKPTEFYHAVQMFCSSIIWGSTHEESSFSSSPLIEIASLLLSYGQYEAAENLFLIIDAYSSKRKVNLSVQNIDGEWCARSHLLGFCLLLRAQNGLHGALKEQKIHDAIRCFFRAASGQGASKSLHNLSYQTGFVYSGMTHSEIYHCY